MSALKAKKMMLYYQKLLCKSIYVNLKKSSFKSFVNSYPDEDDDKKVGKKLKRSQLIASTCHLSFVME